MKIPRVPRPLRIPLLVGGLVFVVLAYFHGGAGWNQNARLDAIFAFVEPGTEESLTFRIDRFLPNTGDYAIHDGHYYANKAPGTILLGVPVYAALFHLEALLGLDAGAPVAAHLNAYLINLFVSVLLVAAAAGVYVWILRRVGLGAGLAAALAIGLFLGTGLFPYSTQLWGHATAGALMVLALGALLAAQGGSRRLLLAAGFCGGWAVATEYQAVLFVALAGLYVVVEHRRRIVYYLAGGLPILVLYAAYHQLAFGSPLALASAYSKADFLDAGNTFGLFGAFSPAVVGQLLFGVYRGIFFQMPILIFAVPGYGFWLRRDRRDGILWISLLTFLGFLAMNASFNGWHGGRTCVSRYLIPVLPLLFLGLKEIPWSRTLRLCFAALATISVFNMLAVAAVNPLCLEDDPNPIYGTTYRLFFEGWMSENRIPIRLQGYDPRWPDYSDWAAWNLGQRLGLQGLPSLLPLVLAAALLALLLGRAIRQSGSAASGGGGAP